MSNINSIKVSHKFNTVYSTQFSDTLPKTVRTFRYDPVNRETSY